MGAACVSCCRAISARPVGYTWSGCCLVRTHSSAEHCCLSCPWGHWEACVWLLVKEPSCVLSSTPTWAPNGCRWRLCVVEQLLRTCCLAKSRACCWCGIHCGCLFVNPLHANARCFGLRLCATSVAVMRQRGRVRPRLAVLKT
jgi:hypothetical protein